jgi:hypothetical protein
MEKMQIILKLLNVGGGINEYRKRIYQFTELLNPRYNIAASESYSSKVLQALKEKVLKKGISFDFPHFVGKTHTSKINHTKGYAEQQFTLTKYM